MIPKNSSKVPLLIKGSQLALSRSVAPNKISPSKYPNFNPRQRLKSPTSMARSDWCYHDNHRRCNLSKRHSKKVSTLRGRPSEAIFRQVNWRFLKCSMVNSALPAIVQTPIARLRRDTTTTPVIISVRFTSREWRKIISKALLFTTVDTAINNSFCRRTWCLATIMHNTTTTWTITKIKDNAPLKLLRGLCLIQSRITAHWGMCHAKKILIMTTLWVRTYFKALTDRDPSTQT